MGKKTARVEIKCPKCGLICLDDASLKRHMDWAHKEKKDASQRES